MGEFDVGGAQVVDDLLDPAADRYTVSFFGTGNATGFGYYQATLGPIEDDAE
ncbi:MAG: hypothetical protein AAGH99_02775 [Planctomycetota bacterium]